MFNILFETDFTDNGNDSNAGNGGGCLRKDDVVPFDVDILFGCSGNKPRKPIRFASLRLWRITVPFKSGDISFFLRRLYKVEDGENSLLCNVDEINSYGLIPVFITGRL